MRGESKLKCEIFQGRFDSLMNVLHKNDNVGGLK